MKRRCRAREQNADFSEEKADQQPGTVRGQMLILGLCPLTVYITPQEHTLAPLKFMGSFWCGGICKAQQQQDSEWGSHKGRDGTRAWWGQCYSFIILFWWGSDMSLEEDLGWKLGGQSWGVKRWCNLQGWGLIVSKKMFAHDILMPIYSVYLFPRHFEVSMLVKQGLWEWGWFL